MAQASKEYFDIEFKKLSQQISRAERILSRSVAISTHHTEKLETLETKANHTEELLDSHTTTLDKIFKNTQDWNTEAAALRTAIKRHEEWIAQIAAKVGVELETRE